MDLADQAYLARLHGDSAKSKELLRKAFEKEREAANIMVSNYDNEPTRSVLHRSAASLAIDCGEMREAERLISSALVGNPPDEIASELRNLFEQVFFVRHLSLRGIELQPNEFQFSIWGELVGYGIAPSEEFIGRVKIIETLIYRTAERKQKKPYRDAGRRKKELEEELDLYITVPRAASFAVSFRLGSQMEFAGMGFGEDVIGEMIECFDLLDKDEIKVLEKRIEDSSYYNNFVGLAQNISPDGKKIKSVGFTTLRAGKEKHVVLSKPRKEVAKVVRERSIAKKAGEEKLEEGEEVCVRGWLRLADSRKPEGLIDIIDGQGVEHMVKVPQGMMADIVRPMFESEVILVGRKVGTMIMLEDIEEVKE
jgi:hypothetical protein